MLKRIYLYSLVCMFFIISSVINADYLLIDQLDFGSIIATEEVNKISVYYISFSDQHEELEIRLASDLVCHAQGYRLPMERLKVKNLDTYQTLNEESVTIMLEKTPNQFVPLVFSLQVLPKDQPGVYESTLHIKGCKGKEPFEQSVHIYVEVQSWMILKTTVAGMEINNHKHDTTLSNQFPVVLKVGANIPWELYGSCSKVNLLAGERLRIKLHANSEAGFQTYPGEIFLGEEPTLLVIGSSVLRAPYWVEIPFILEVSDYTELPAGQLELGLLFQVLPQVQSWSSLNGGL